MNTRLFLALAFVTNYSGLIVKRTASRAVRLLQLATIVLCCFCCEAYAQGVAEPLFTLRQVGPNVWAAISNGAANTGFVIGDDGVVVIDTTASVDIEGNFSPEHGRQILAAIRKLTNLPVKFVINTRKLPRQADSSIGDFSADEGLGRNVSGGTRPRLSWGRSPL